MKKLTITISFIAMFVIGFTTNAAQKATVETVITCQQDDGDKWVEVGIILNDGPGLRALVVQHDGDDNSSKLVADRQVLSKKQGRKTVYEDSLQTIRLVVEKKKGTRVATLDLLQDGPGGFSKGGLFCYKNSDISYDK